MKIRFHKLLPVACVYFFADSADFLPQGLLLTSLLSPLFLVWLYSRGSRLIVEPFLVVMMPFFLAALAFGANWGAYWRSFFHLFAIYLTVVALAVAVRRFRSLDSVFFCLIVLNIPVTLLGIGLRFTPYAHLMWQDLDKQSTGILEVIRYRMFTYEPSYFSTVMVPLVAYAYWRLWKKRNIQSSLLVIAALLPLGLSLSFGVIATLLASILLVHAISRRSIKNFVWVIIATSLVAATYFALPTNGFIRSRMENIVAGRDSSGYVRTTGSYYAAYEMAASRDLALGVGPGQISTYGDGFMDWQSGRLGSAVSETLALYGIVGITLRFGAELFFFLKAKPYRSRFRLTLFIFAFLYQFTGSFTTNLAEYVIWVLSFSPALTVFDESSAQPPRESYKRSVIGVSS